MVGTVNFSAIEEQAIDICLTLANTMRDIVEAYTPEIYHPALANNPKPLLDCLRRKFFKALLARQHTRGPICEYTGKLFSSHVSITWANAKWVASNLEIETDGFRTWNVQLSSHSVGYIIIRVDADEGGGKKSGDDAEMVDSPVGRGIEKDIARLTVLECAREVLEKEIDTWKDRKEELADKWKETKEDVHSWDHFSREEKIAYLRNIFEELKVESENASWMRKTAEGSCMQVEREIRGLQREGIEHDDENEEYVTMEIVNAGPSCEEELGG
ncbi:hypothetical protein EJ08DRAFT_714553 [Tothia fuscella]|uniref:Uncharacterized protein n=1 Tax=Tothia fuscella TaxID=1048955 RepID=A0A9P4P3K1_9PEZI|nr:hypothetical protein EJ08DRAFT_714553 [Tothia fuscella]